MEMPKRSNFNQSQKVYFGRAISMGTISLFAFMTLQIGCANKTQQEGESANVTANNVPSSLSSLRKVFVDEAMLEEIKPHKTECSAEEQNAGSQPKICITICHVPPGNAAAAKDLVIPLQALKAHLNHGSKKHEVEHRDYLGSCVADDSSSGSTTDTSGDSNSSGDTTSSGDSGSTDGSVATDPTTGMDGSQTTDSGTVTDGAPSTDPTAGTDGSSTTDPVTGTDSSQSTGGTPTDGTTSTDPTQGSSSGGTGSDTVIPLWCQAYVNIDNNCDGFDDVTGDPLL